MLKVRDVQESSDTPCIITIDPYVPISFRSNSRVLGGARYIQLTNFTTHLLELQFPAESLMVCGFTLVSAEVQTGVCLTGGGPEVEGFPLFSFPDGVGFSDKQKIPRFGIESTVALSYQNSHAEIQIGAPKTFNSTVSHKRVQFCLFDDVLVGIRVLALTEQEQTVLRDYVAEHRTPPVPE